MDPERIPRQIREAFEQYWKHLAAVAVGFVGSKLRNSFERAQVPTTDAVLLDLPSSYLLGWEFGDGSRLGVFLATNQLEKGRHRSDGGFPG